MSNSTMPEMGADPTQPIFNRSQVYEQPINITSRFGETAEFPLWYFDVMLKGAVKQSIMHASQLGANSILLVVLLLLTKRERRRSPVFVLNTTALFLDIIYTTLRCCFLTSSLGDVYPLLFGDPGVFTPAARRLFVAGFIFVILVVICIQASLLLQVRVIVTTLRSWQKYSIMVVSVFVALTAVAFQVVQSTVKARCIYRDHDICGAEWPVKAKDFSLTASICFFSIIFCTKLGWSLRERRKLGMKQFGSMQIILIGGFQTMILPAIFSTLQFVKARQMPQVNYFILGITCISLPLTSLWASSQSNTTSSPAAAARNYHFQHNSTDNTRDTGGFPARKLSDSLQWSTSTKLTSRSSASDRLGVLSSVDSRSDVEGWGKISPTSRHTVGVRDVERDLEMQELRDKE